MATLRTSKLTFRETLQKMCFQAMREISPGSILLLVVVVAVVLLLFFFFKTILCPFLTKKG